MSKVLTNEQNYYDIANTIRQMKNVNTTYKPRQMASALKDIYSNEVEGTLPLSFEANGNNLLDYRIDGASGGVGDRTSNLFDKNNPTMLTELYMSVTGLANVTSSYSRSIVIPCTPATTYSIKFKYETYTLRIASFSSYPTANKVGNDVNNVANGIPCNNASYTTSETANYLMIFCYNVATQESGNYSIDEFFSEIMVCQSPTPLSYEPYGYKVPVVVNGKNLLNNVLTSRTLNGVTITVNQDKSINISGQLDVSYKDFYVSGQWNSDVPLFEEGTYKLIVESTNNNIPITCGFNGSYATGVTGTGNRVFTNQISSIMFRLTDSMTLNNETLKIMVCKPIIEDTSYEPYHETTTNIYLDEPILENESISLSDTNTNIPTIDGTNVITIDTTVQPSNVYIQAPKDSLEAIQIANRLEEI